MKRVWLIIVLSCIWVSTIAQCIDYLDLTADNSGQARCYSGDTENLFLLPGAVDYGETNELSLHAIQSTPNAYDPRTDNRLPTIPQGATHSIRLGGYWDRVGNHTATILYPFHVPYGGEDRLVLRFAPVLEYSERHQEQDEARFCLEIITEEGRVDSSLYRDFLAGYGDTRAWHTCVYQEKRTICYSDWQTVTLDLNRYRGQHLTIRLTAYTCTETIHLGYAYFTLHCEDGSGEVCEDSLRAQVAASYEREASTCRNYVTFHNQSQWPGRISNYYVRWLYGDGEEDAYQPDSTAHLYSPMGGHYTAHLIVGPSALCTDTFTMELNLPQLTHYDREIVYRDTLCSGLEYHAMDSLCRYTSQWGCDSVVRYHTDIFPVPYFRLLTDSLDLCPEKDRVYIRTWYQTGGIEYLVLRPDTRLVEQGMASEYRYGYDDSIWVSVPGGIRPNHYTCTLYAGGRHCESSGHTLHFTTRYPSSIIADKGAFLALLNEDYNGGYRFRSYQWYRDGEPIEGATDAYLKIDASSSSSADWGHAFSVMLIRSGEDEGFFTCPYVPGTATDLDAVSDTHDPTKTDATKFIQSSHLYIRIGERVYDMTGTCVSE